VGQVLDVDLVRRGRVELGLEVFILVELDLIKYIYLSFIHINTFILKNLFLKNVK